MGKPSDYPPVDLREAFPEPNDSSDGDLVFGWVSLLFILIATFACGGWFAVRSPGPHQLQGSALCVPYETVAPQTWHPALCGRHGKGKAEAKARALQVVQQRLPGFTLPKGKGKREGIVDAACLALWGQQQRMREVA